MQSATVLAYQPFGIILLWFQKIACTMALTLRHRNVLGIAVVVVALLSSCFAATAAAAAAAGESVDDVHSNTEEAVPSYTTVRSRQTNVYVIPNFLRHDLAVQWRDAMKQLWDGTNSTCSATSSDGSVCDNSEKSATSSWQFTTNNNGVLAEVNSNAKVRSLDNIDARNKTAHILKAHGLFSYAKWELHPSHPLVQEIEHAFSTEIKDTVEQFLRLNHPNVKLAPHLSDLFVTFYSTGDFLSSHNDFESGTWAFVVSLMDGPTTNDDPNNNNAGGGGPAAAVWDATEFGGGLRFECPKAPLHLPPTRDDEWCHVLYPSFNSAILFQTRVPSGSGPFHEVLPVNWKAQEQGFYRFGLTGWYMDVADELSDVDRVERDKMRARD